MDIHVTVNGRPEIWQAAPGESVLELVRRQGLTSVKRGCSQGDCGACTILMDGQAMRACLLVAAQLEGRTVTTAEGLGSLETPHPLQRAFVDAGAVQCGFCTPGMLLASQALLAQTPRPDEAAVREALDGNLCRCTGYKKIIEAVLLAAERMG
jgi:aerobic carbon-monoxide dehydrogenase small subunit